MLGIPALTHSPMPTDAQTLWLLAGVLLIIAEFFAPGVLIVFFGIGAIATAFATRAGWTTDIGSQAALFAIVSVSSLLAMRRFVKAWFVGSSGDQRSSDDEDFIGREARVITALPGQGGDGLVEIKGSNWKARSETPVPVGATVIIERREGLTFYVQPRI
ncbi:MAG: NfeD family protein [Verrucomicrobia bacterium]|nr:MAG: NfeD family protein [Verrucomicrobiota bacterium]TAE86823.1 MAG: NfeD family protein [Verrucomicrobiota bacterium]TAF24596.1 MAG: NfeD family protein [Verrucomicrobiota bacterium]TAF40496.1 MAG: NfeD family protein [Verrucomicrobiota bacterium]